MRICKEVLLGEGKFLALHELEYEDRHGVLRKWERASRRRNCGAVVIIATLIPSGKLVMIRQYRPPTGKTVLEFPAGLMENNEAPELTALRELREETGYIGTVDSVSSMGYSSPGMIGETAYLVKMRVQEREQTELKTDFDEAEDIETILVDPKQLSDFIRQEEADGNGIDLKVVAYAAALSWGV
jgi:8-oxo-dGTP pyrophosphatase MutT (NUDIX family)